jgi:hypothetical protein
LGSKPVDAALAMPSQQLRDNGETSPGQVHISIFNLHKESKEPGSDWHPLVGMSMSTRAAEGQAQLNRTVGGVVVNAECSKRVKCTILFYKAAGITCKGTIWTLES